MKLLCTIFGKAWVQPFNGDGYCVWHYTDVQPTANDYHSWYVTIAVIVIGLFFIFIFFKLHEAKEVINNAPSDEPTISEVIIQGGRVVKAWKAEKDHGKSEARIEAQLKDILK